jgi:hypothetical protein
MHMGQSVRIPITNVFMDGDYTGQIFVGAANKQLNVILDTGSSALAAALKNEPVSVSKLDLPSWPTISFVLQGDTGDVTLNVTPDNYWQVDAGKVGEALLGFTPGQPGLSILGLPLMNGYFTIFDGEADGGVGSILFATRT